MDQNDHRNMDQAQDGYGRNIDRNVYGQTRRNEDHLRLSGRPEGAEDSEWGRTKDWNMEARQSGTISRPPKNDDETWLGGRSAELGRDRDRDWSVGAGGERKNGRIGEVPRVADGMWFTSKAAEVVEGRNSNHDSTGESDKSRDWKLEPARDEQNESEVAENVWLNGKIAEVSEDRARATDWNIEPVRANPSGSKLAQDEESLSGKSAEVVEHRARDRTRDWNVEAMRDRRSLTKDEDQVGLNGKMTHVAEERHRDRHKDGDQNVESATDSQMESGVAQNQDQGALSGKTTRFAENRDKDRNMESATDSQMESGVAQNQDQGALSGKTTRFAENRDKDRNVESATDSQMESGVAQNQDQGALSGKTTRFAENRDKDRNMESATDSQMESGVAQNQDQGALSGKTTRFAENRDKDRNVESATDSQMESGVAQNQDQGALSGKTTRFAENRDKDRNVESVKDRQTESEAVQNEDQGALSGKTTRVAENRDKDRNMESATDSQMESGVAQNQDQGALSGKTTRFAENRDKDRNVESVKDRQTESEAVQNEDQGALSGKTTRVAENRDRNRNVESGTDRQSEVVQNQDQVGLSGKTTEIAADRDRDRTKDRNVEPVRDLQNDKVGEVARVEDEAWPSGRADEGAEFRSRDRDWNLEPVRDRQSTSEWVQSEDQVWSSGKTTGAAWDRDRERDRIVDGAQGEWMGGVAMVEASVRDSGSTSDVQGAGSREEARGRGGVWNAYFSDGPLFTHPDWRGFESRAENRAKDPMEAAARSDAGGERVRGTADPMVFRSAADDDAESGQLPESTARALAVTGERVDNDGAVPSGLDAAVLDSDSRATDEERAGATTGRDQALGSSTAGPPRGTVHVKGALYELLRRRRRVPDQIEDKSGGDLKREDESGDDLKANHRSPAVEQMERRDFQKQTGAALGDSSESWYPLGEVGGADNDMEAGGDVVKDTEESSAEEIAQVAPGAGIGATAPRDSEDLDAEDMGKEKLGGQEGAVHADEVDSKEDGVKESVVEGTHGVTADTSGSDGEEVGLEWEGEGEKDGEEKGKEDADSLASEGDANMGPGYLQWEREGDVRLGQRQREWEAEMARDRLRWEREDEIGPRVQWEGEGELAPDRVQRERVPLGDREAGPATAETGDVPVTFAESLEQLRTRGQQGVGDAVHAVQHAAETVQQNAGVALPSGRSLGDRATWGSGWGGGGAGRQSFIWAGGLPPGPPLALGQIKSRILERCLAASHCFWSYVFRAYQRGLVFHRTCPQWYPSLFVATLSAFIGSPPT